jgi:hypothetical protein
LSVAAIGSRYPFSEVGYVILASRPAERSALGHDHLQLPAGRALEPLDGLDLDGRACHTEVLQTGAHPFAQARRSVDGTVPERDPEPQAVVWFTDQGSNLIQYFWFPFGPD